MPAVKVLELARRAWQRAEDRQADGRCTDTRRSRHTLAETDDTALNALATIRQRHRRT
jgi:hypothetical protein